MNKEITFGKKALSIALTASIAAAGFGGIGYVSLINANAAENNYELVDEIQDGTILHCFDWKYTDIKDELENIAKAGFTSIQTSPVQSAEGAGAWWWLYQPLGFYVPETSELGTKEELRELCESAHEYGINVIVDVVANHLADNHENIQKDLVDEEYWHDGKYSTSKNNVNWNDRYQVTHCDIGMSDLNSENEYVQKVVAEYIDELKELGVDGIRWDAAKHIGLPSEDCNFWPAVTDSGLYNYGEILTGPTDGGSNEDLMKEYTDYMSVTDSSYGSSLLNAFNSGKAPSSDGNWSNKGVAADKLVYWGESHDTYSNGEGKESNGVSQNVVDRAYAAAAAREGVSALYLSRPYATARDSIRIGVKGSTHFMSDEIAAVNHFHNAMNGLADYYTVSDNCAVITRQGGGAVIVCGSGSGEVTVENGGSYAKPGTYKDEITGNEFVVTEDTITGTVGESGIAVVYDSSFTSRVSVSPESDTSFNDTLTVTLKAIDVTDAKYTTSEGAEGSFVNGDIIEIGANSEGNTTITVTVTGTASDGKEVSSTYKYKKELSRTYPTLEKGGVVFNNTEAGWSEVNVYVYDESGAVTITNGEWPGVAMTDSGEGYFKYELPEQFAECSHIMIIFNNGLAGGDQIPGAMQAGLTMSYTDKKLYDGTKWLDLPNSEDPGTVTPEDPEKPSDPVTPDDPENPENPENPDNPGTVTPDDSNKNSNSSDGKNITSNNGNSGNSSSNSNDSASVIAPNNNNSSSNNNTNAGSNNGTSNSSSDNNSSNSDNGNVSTSDATAYAAAIAFLAALASSAIIFMNSRKRKKAE